MRRFWKPLLIGGLALLAAAQVLFFSPSPIEENERSRAPIDPKELLDRVDGPKKRLAPDLPVGRIPEYEVNDFTYVSTEKGVKQWKIDAKRAFFYQKEKIVHSKDVVAYLYDDDGSATVVTGLESKYVMDKKDLEIFGDATSKFPDGFGVKSEYMHYAPATKTVTIPPQFFVEGGGDEDPKTGEKLGFTSFGMISNMKDRVITLSRRSHVIFDQKKTNEKGQPVREETTVDSDWSRIDRKIQVATFEMDESRPDKERFVIIKQEKLNAKGRRSEMKYGDKGEKLQRMVLYDDVVLRDLAAQPPQYATAGQADFEKRRNVVILTKYPQVYQGGDTVTGEKILLHRTTNLVEVEESNSFKGESNNGVNPQSDIFDFVVPSPLPSPSSVPSPLTQKKIN